jgi:hypothetical protein
MVAKGTAELAVAPEPAQPVFAVDEVLLRRPGEPDHWVS